MSLPKALLVNADGTTESICASEAAGLYVMRKKTCGECGRHIVTRSYKAHWAHNMNTKVEGKPLADAWGPPNDGTIVLIEEPGP